jgi:hypothetical protein
MYQELFKLDDEFSVEADSITFSLKRTYMDTKIWRRTGKEVTKEHEDRWFYPTLEGILLRYVRETGRQVEGLDEYIKKLDEIKELLSKFSKTFIIEERPITLVE